MDQISTPVKLLYYLNLPSKKRSILESILMDNNAWHYYIEINNVSGVSNAQQTTKRIVKKLRMAAK